ncbi:NAD(P) transhydrogenase subunit alpha part 1 [Methylobacterium cerastii]|uniref:proton-translocating NAD(P)(+) transhydrogenase n=1 Tax=Methylobacterium cerastii TaxID=932741 RepID=A0ABQ4QDD6_9HYPH|nr:MULTISPECIES: Re/Si-specific NAD(P)(+) transhydrogenase subunit alpha [Methylobacterium]TXM73905.1 Re/Si-specific NAD(P)(+) transhydrogenase subunit alpha [Methylobacterium sp. WL12]TXN06515.1 Re/Si-specific NAD(P)(+) transhydrogenase subunit alpha [Methylobacterium sp. WL122]TXN84393.1 Re/Si-specific NAD(P)(+) transhydrogenase subunit alpha [Methylobacterium sp. WL8]GJD43183.1 NAD(P) transhydrogenase subunit alpha part 1 [Methylobacterium cerastii]
MRIAVLSETDSAEPRVAAVPETVKKFLALGADVTVQSGAGLRAGMPDSEYEAVGASVAGSAEQAARDADLILKVRRPGADELKLLKRGAVVVAIMDPYGHEAELQAMAEAGVDGFAMELMPRITRAQVMDVLSSQANLAGYRAVVDGASEYGRAMPMMMTAAGTVPAARVFVMGVGVAGLQAIATARRMGAVVTATDVRPATKEQVESLGAKFVAVEDDEFKQAETKGGYAKEMSAEYQKKQADLVATHIAKQDIVITTALIPGRPAPKLVSAAMVASMKPGSVLVDLAVERGGNVEGAKPGEVVVNDRGVKIVGHLNVAGRLAASASALYARNLYAFVETLVDKESKALAIKWDDELVKATNLTHDGSVVHPSFQPKADAAVADRPKDSPQSEPASVGLSKTGVSASPSTQPTGAA